jgi:hypothetical protein
LAQLRRESFHLRDAALGAVDVGRFEQRAGAMVGRVPCELAAAELLCQRRQLPCEREPLRERERVVDREESERRSGIVDFRISERCSREDESFSGIGPDAVIRNRARLTACSIPAQPRPNVRSLRFLRRHDSELTADLAYEEVNDLTMPRNR